MGLSDAGRPVATTIRWLLLAGFLSTCSRALTLPFLAIFMARSLSLGPQEVGWALGLSLWAGGLAGLLGGFWIDKANKAGAVLWTSGITALALAAFPWAGSVAAAVALLAVANAAGALLEIAVKASFAQLLPEAERMKAFSASYTVANVAYAIAPALGALVYAQGQTALFLLSAALALAAMLLPLAGLWRCRHQLRPVAASAATDWRSALGVLRADRALLCFSLGGLLCAIVYGRFSAFLSQYLTVVADEQTAYRMVAYAITCNSVLVVALQYFVGRSLTRERLYRAQALATGLLVAGLLGFAVDHGYLAWGLAMLVFTFGEMIAVPASYAFVDHIAPEHLKGLYYSIEHVSGLGSAMTPILCGLLLAHTPAPTLFLALGACAVLSLAFYARGCRCAAWGRPAGVVAGP